MNVDPPGLKMAALATWLRANVREFDTTTDPQVRLLAGGRSNVTYQLTDGSGRSWALRRPPLGHVMPTAHDMSREFRVMSGLGKVDYPVPSMTAFCADEQVIGAPFILMDFVEGRSIATSDDSHEATPRERASASKCLSDCLIDLHGIDLIAAGLQDFGKQGGYLHRQVERWTKQWSLTQTRELEILDQLFFWLSKNKDSCDDSESVLIHGDLRLDNILLDQSCTQALAVVDWEMSTLGHPVADLAVSLVYWSEPGDELRNDLPVANGVTVPTGFWSRQDLIHDYATRRDTDLEQLDFCTALACAKLAVIMESIHYRQMSGQQLGASLEKSENMQLAAEALAKMGMEVTSLGALKGLAA